MSNKHGTIQHMKVKYTHNNNNPISKTYSFRLPDSSIYLSQKKTIIARRQVNGISLQSNLTIRPN